MAVFFLDADEQIYARYGGRDAKGADTRQSLDGLRYTMNSVLEMHQRKDKVFAPRSEEGRKTIRDVPTSRSRRGCYHCHQVRETLDDDLKRKGKWDRDLAFRYPLPDNLGLFLEVDRGNVVERVQPESPAAKAGLKKGDVVQLLGGVPVHSIADAQFALERAPKKGAVEIAWKRGDKATSAELALAEGWRKADIRWRPSLLHMRPSLPVYGDDLTAEEKKALGVEPKQLAFRQRMTVPPRVAEAGVRGGDVILGVDDRKLEGDAGTLIEYIRREFLVGDRVTLNVVRDGKRLNLPVTLR
jgi:S1-C subfamily serine protease